jgi:hypothetical protein
MSARLFRQCQEELYGWTKQPRLASEASCSALFVEVVRSWVHAQRALQRAQHRGVQLGRAQKGHAA